MSASYNDSIPSYENNLAYFKADRLRQQLISLHKPRFYGRKIYKSEQEWHQALSDLWRGRKVAVWGAAITGLAAAQLLAKLGAQVILSDSRPLTRPTELHPSIQFISGQANSFEEVELIIPSPGLKPSHPLFTAAQQADIPLMSEIELALWCSRAQVIAITGTDGKSTTTCLITHFLNALGIRAWGVGNLGEPISIRALQATSDDVLVCEVSAFQLWSTQFFPAQVSIITNIAEDHLDYFDGHFDAYKEAKLKLVQLSSMVGGTTLTPPSIDLHHLNMQSKKFAIADENLEIDLNQVDLYVQNNQLYTQTECIADLSESPLIGRHNQLNICAALLALECFGVSMIQALMSLPHFKGLPHRMALVKDHQGIRWVNDSKATNVHASLAGLKSVDDRLILIVGGKEKGLNYEPLYHHLIERASQGRLHRILLIGEIAQRLNAELSNLGLSSLVDHCNDMTIAVRRASELAQASEMVLLSPASSSFDQFISFEERGKCFEDLVLALH